MSTGDCVFCRIAAGVLPSTKIYEDEAHLAFLDIGPINPGHTLVIPRRHAERFLDLDPEEASALIRVVRRVAEAVASGTGCEGFNLHQSNGACAGQVVPHVHFHIIPRFENDGHSFHWRQERYESEERMEETARRIRAFLDGSANR